MITKTIFEEFKIAKQKDIAKSKKNEIVMKMCLQTGLRY